VLANRNVAGRELARVVRPRAQPGSNAIVMALPRGGVTVATQISAALRLPLDVVLAHESELGIVVEGCNAEIDHARAAQLGLDRDDVDARVAAIRAELARDALMLRGRRPFPTLWQRTVILVDDGSTSAHLIDAVVRLLRSRGVARVILASPIAARTLFDGFAAVDDDNLNIETQ
jgi:putative phosphoribosyl transferase